jgi:LmbE family N-acetylglucosaminyl deacetylase
VFELVPTLAQRPVLSLLCLGAHSDDIEIGCGGTILRLLSSYKRCHVTWVVFSAEGKRRNEAQASAGSFLKDARTKTIIIKRYKESFFPYRAEEIKKLFEQLKMQVSPDLILTHYRHDLHQDHRVICELTWNTFRNHQILEYEIPKYDGDLGQPNVYVPLSQKWCKEKVQYLTERFVTQSSKQWFTEDTFFSLLRLRGVEANAPEKYAEAFYGRKIVLR